MDDFISIVKRVDLARQIRDSEYYAKATKFLLASLVPGTHFLYKDKSPLSGSPIEYIFVRLLNERTAEIQRPGNPTLWNLNALALVVPMPKEDQG